MGENIMLTYQVLGPDERGLFAVVYMIPNTFREGRYSAVGTARTREQAEEEARRLNEPPCERRLALRAKANRIVSDISDEEKQRRGIR